jgi:hypothetical protein
LDSKEQSILDRSKPENHLLVYPETYFIKRPLIRVQLNNTPNNQQPTLIYTFVGSSHNEVTFKFGRNNDNDVIIN